MASSVGWKCVGAFDPGSILTSPTLSESAPCVPSTIACRSTPGPSFSSSMSFLSSIGISPSRRVSYDFTQCYLIPAAARQG